MKKELAVDIGLLCIGILLVSLLYTNVLLLTLVLAAGAVVVLKFWHSYHDTIFFLVAVAVGTLGEIVAVSFGAWRYAYPTFLSIPLWLPLAWGLAAVIIKRLAYDVQPHRMRRHGAA